MPAFAWFILIISTNLQTAHYYNGDVHSPFTFTEDDVLLSHNSNARLKLQDDGNFVLHKYSGSDWYDAGWETATNPSNSDSAEGHHVDFQNDGKLVVFDDKGRVIWQSNPLHGTAPFRLIVTDNAAANSISPAAYILDATHKIVWSTNGIHTDLQTIWIEPFTSNALGWSLNGDIRFNIASSNCPNDPERCLRVTWEDIGQTCCWPSLDTDISSYRAVQLQVDIAGNSLESSDGDACEIWWQVWSSVGKYNWEEYATHYPDDKVYKDVIIDFPISSYAFSQYLTIDLSVHGHGTSDRCYFDNAILRGVTTQSPTPSPTDSTSSPTRDPTNHPTLNPTKFPISNPTFQPTPAPTSKPTGNPTPAPTNPTRNPSVFPTNNPTLPPSYDPTHNTRFPTVVPTLYPTLQPTLSTASPTEHPTVTPSITANESGTLKQRELTNVWMGVSEWVGWMVVSGLVAILLFIICVAFYFGKKYTKGGRIDVELAKNTGTYGYKPYAVKRTISLAMTEHEGVRRNTQQRIVRAVSFSDDMKVTDEGNVNDVKVGSYGTGNGDAMGNVSADEFVVEPVATVGEAICEPQNVRQTTRAGSEEQIVYNEEYDVDYIDDEWEYHD